MQLPTRDSVRDLVRECVGDGVRLTGAVLVGDGVAVELWLAVAVAVGVQLRAADRESVSDCDGDCGLREGLWLLELEYVRVRVLPVAVAVGRVSERLERVHEGEGVAEGVAEGVGIRDSVAVSDGDRVALPVDGLQLHDAVIERVSLAVAVERDGVGKVGVSEAL